MRKEKRRLIQIRILITYIFLKLKQFIIKFSNSVIQFLFEAIVTNNVENDVT